MNENNDSPPVEDLIRHVWSDNAETRLSSIFALGSTNFAGLPAAFWFTPDGDLTIASRDH